MRLFFDILKQQSPTYDFHGYYFRSKEDAALMAELIAADLGISDTDDWIGALVEVRTAANEMLFCVPVLAAA